MIIGIENGKILSPEGWIHRTLLGYPLRKYQASRLVRFVISILSISSANPMFDHLFESSHRDDSNKCLKIGFAEETKHFASIEVQLIGTENRKILSQQGNRR